jgi:hypothetical protein
VTNNASSVIANGVEVEDVLDANQTFVSASGPAGVTYVQSGQKVTFNVGAVTQLQTINLTVVATPTTTGSVANTATVKEITSDPNTANNSSSINTTVYTRPTCGITGGVETINAGGSTHWCATTGMSIYAWSGPGGFAETTECVDVSIAGEYTVIITNANGCTSTCKRTLIVNPGCTPTSHTTTTSQCDGSYTWAAPLGNGVTYTQSVSGITNVSTNADGCTHTETLNLTINHSSSHTTTASSVMAAIPGQHH